MKDIKDRKLSFQTGKNFPWVGVKGGGNERSWIPGAEGICAKDRSLLRTENPRAKTAARLSR